MTAVVENCEKYAHNLADAFDKAAKGDSDMLDIALYNMAYNLLDGRAPSEDIDNIHDFEHFDGEIYEACREEGVGREACIDLAEHNVLCKKQTRVTNQSNSRQSLTEEVRKITQVTVTDVAMHEEDKEPRVIINFDGNVTNKQAHTAEVILGGVKRTLTSEKPAKAAKKKTKVWNKTHDPVAPGDKTQFVSVSFNTMFLITYQWYSRTALQRELTGFRNSLREKKLQVTRLFLSQLSLHLRALTTANTNFSIMDRQVYGWRNVEHWRRYYIQSQAQMLAGPGQLRVFGNEPTNALELITKRAEGFHQLLQTGVMNIQSRSEVDGKHLAWRGGVVPQVIDQYTEQDYLGMIDERFRRVVSLIGVTIYPGLSAMMALRQIELMKQIKMTDKDTGEREYSERIEPLEENLILLQTKTKKFEVEELNKSIRNGIKELIRDYQEDFGISFDYAKVEANNVKCEDTSRYRYLTNSQFYYIQTRYAKCTNEYQVTYASEAHKLCIRAANQDMEVERMSRMEQRATRLAMQMFRNGNQDEDGIKVIDNLEGQSNLSDRSIDWDEESFEDFYGEYESN